MQADLIELGGIYERLSPFGKTILLKIARKYESGEREHGRADRSELSLEDWLNHTQEEALDLMVYPEIIRTLYDVERAPKRNSPSSDLMVYPETNRDPYDITRTHPVRTTDHSCACGYYCERCEQS